MAGIGIQTLAAFAATCAVIELTPGPNMAYLAVLAATEGRRRGYAAVAGVALGLLIVGLLAAFGLAAVISASPLLYQALRWAGVAYLLWLAWDAWFSADDEVDELRTGSGRYFRRGLVVNLLNPKAGLFYVAMLPGFVDPASPVLMQTVLLSVIFVIIATAIHAGIVTMSGALRSYLSNERSRRIVRRWMAGVLVLIALWFAWSTKG